MLTPTDFDILKSRSVSHCGTVRQIYAGGQRSLPDTRNGSVWKLREVEQTLRYEPGDIIKQQ